jgi:hypothetical protein
MVRTMRCDPIANDGSDYGDGMDGALKLGHAFDSADSWGLAQASQTQYRDMDACTLGSREIEVSSGERWARCCAKRFAAPCSTACVINLIGCCVLAHHGWMEN